MAQVMYRRSDGSVGVFPTARGQALLTGEGWKPLDAKSLPYTSHASGRLDNISTALDYILQQLGELGRDVEAVSQQASGSAVDSTATLAAVKTTLSGLEQQVNYALKRVERDTHRPISVSRSSNPALQFEAVSQALRLDLSIAGSFDDSAAKIGAISIQAAITRLSSLIGELRNDYYRVWNEAVALSNKVGTLEGRLTIAEKQNAQDAADRVALEAKLTAMISAATVAPPAQPAAKKPRASRAKKPKATSGG